MPIWASEIQNLIKKNTCPNASFYFHPKEKEFIFLYWISYVPQLHFFAFAYLIRATVIFLVFQNACPNLTFYLPRAIGASAYVAPCNYICLFIFLLLTSLDTDSEWFDACWDPDNALFDGTLTKKFTANETKILWTWNVPEDSFDTSIGPWNCCVQYAVFCNIFYFMVGFLCRWLGVVNKNSLIKVIFLQLWHMHNFVWIPVSS